MALKCEVVAVDDVVVVAVADDVAVLNPVVDGVIDWIHNSDPFEGTDHC